MGGAFDKRFVIMAGKGGVGKSTMCAAFALAAARRGKRVLIVELASKEKAPQLFGHRGQVGYKLTRIHDGIECINVTPAPALEEYGLMKLRWKRLYQAVFENDLMRALLRLIPGMNELLLVGKAWNLEQERGPDGRPRWDLLVVDAPATGHGVSLFRLPHVVLDTVKTGPMADEVLQIRDMLVDPERSLLNIVTLPEEMPVNECLDLEREGRESLRIPPGFLLINGVWPQAGTPEQEAALNRVRAGHPDPAVKAALDTVSFMWRRRHHQEPYLERLARESALPSVEIGFQFVPEFGFGAVETISRVLDAAVDAAAEAA